jgi:hypothetical protein
MSNNRVVVGLPERYEKAKRQIAVLEQREADIRKIINEYASQDRGMMIEYIIEILDGKWA